jgi:hypothetical protein
MGGGVGLSFLLGSIVPVMLRSNIGGHVLFILPTVLSFFLCSYIKSFIKISATSLKAIYFSIFYVSLNKPLEISESFREEVTNYLNFKDSSAVKSVKNNIRNIVEVSSKNQESTNTNKKSPISAEKVQVTKKTNNIDPKLVKKAQLYIIEMKNKGASDQQIISFFTNKGWPEDLVRQLIDSKQEAV